MSEARRLRATTMRYDRLVRAEEAARALWERGRQSGDAITPSLVAAFAAAFAEAEVRAAVAEAQQERDEARAIARVLAHAYDTDTRPPARLIAVARTYPLDPRAALAARVGATPQE